MKVFHFTTDTSLVTFLLRYLNEIMEATNYSILKYKVETDVEAHIFECLLFYIIVKVFLHKIHFTDLTP